MKKMKTVFVNDYENYGLATHEVRKGCEWVLKGEGVATLKIDGTATIFMNGKLYKRFDRKLTKRFERMRKRKKDKFIAEPHMFRELPEGAIPCEEKPDEVTFHHPHWVPIGDGNEDAFYREAIENADKLEEGKTYELIGPKINGNPYDLDKHILVEHGSEIVENIDLSYEGLKKWLKDNFVEGLVFHHPDGRVAKLRKKDMFRLEIERDWTSKIIE